MSRRPCATIVDDSTLPGRLGSRPFDGEGVRTRRNAILDGRRFKAFLFDSYYARRTGAARRQRGTHGRLDRHRLRNLVWAAGATSAQRLIGGVADGLYLTDYGSQRQQRDRRYLARRRRHLDRRAAS